jgi:hypothetical protein
MAQDTRPAQDTHMLYNCIMNSLTKEGKNKILIWKEQYKLVARSDPNDAASEGVLPSGAALLKVVIRESHLDTNATTNSIRVQLSSLDTYMPSVSSDITKFNSHVKLLITGLQARGEDTTDLLINLFKGYKAANDGTFVKYIEGKEEKFDDGEDIEPNSLMKLADNKYKDLVVKGTWSAPTDDQKNILALESKVSKLVNQLKNGEVPEQGEERHGKIAQRVPEEAIPRQA